MMDQTLIGALAAWLVYWVFAAVSAHGVVGFPKPVEEAVMSWGWMLAPLLVAIGIVRWLVGLAWWPKSATALEPGDHIVYTMAKQSAHPGPRARSVHAHDHGEGYSYVVPKLWTVLDHDAEGELIVVTPGGKHHHLRDDDPHIHPVSTLGQLSWELRLHKHFPAVGEAA